MTLIQELLSLNEATASLADAAMDIYTAFKNSSLKKRYTQLDEPMPKGTSIEFAIRDWGDWQVPAGVEDDGDYDWEEPTPATVKAGEELLKSCEKRFPAYKFTLHAGEKNWLYVSVKAK